MQNLSHQRTEPAEQQPATHPLSQQMIEQINIALEQKGSEFLSLESTEACRQGTNVERGNMPIN